MDRSLRKPTAVCAAEVTQRSHPVLWYGGFNWLHDAVYIYGLFRYFLAIGTDSERIFLFS